MDGKTTKPEHKPIVIHFFWAQKTETSSSQDSKTMCQPRSLPKPFISSRYLNQAIKHGHTYWRTPVERKQNSSAKLEPIALEAGEGRQILWGSSKNVTTLTHRGSWKLESLGWDLENCDRRGHDYGVYGARGKKETHAHDQVGRSVGILFGEALFRVGGFGWTQLEEKEVELRTHLHRGGLRKTRSGTSTVSR